MNAFRKRSGWSGFTVLELLITVVVVFFLAGLILPALVRPPRCRIRVNCVNNLKQTGLAFRLWSDDNNSKYPMAYAGDARYPLVNHGVAWTDIASSAQNQFTVFESMSNELSRPRVVVCPQDTRKAATNFTTDFSNSHVSFFVGLDANEMLPGTFLAGDRNLTNGRLPINGILDLRTNQNIGWTREMHNQMGNVALGDGSVVQLANRQFSDYLARTGLGTNRLVFPQ